MKLRKSGETVLRNVERPESTGEQTEGIQTLTIQPLSDHEAIECDIWVDIDGNPRAWTPINSGVLSVAFHGDDPTEDALNIYRSLRDESRTAKAAEERIAELEAMVAQLAAQIAQQ